jgi:uncharacterized protein (TIGR02466 family)
MQHNSNEHLQAIFPSLVYYKKFVDKEFEKIQSEIKPAIEQSELGMPWPEAVETTFKFKQNNNIIDQYNMSILKDSILQTAHNYLRSIPTKLCPEMYIESNWISKIGQNGSMHAHTHPFSFLSGCYYYQTTGSDGNLVFENPNLVADWMDPYGDIWPTNYFVTPSEGLMVLFPSWLRHRVDINHTNNNRWSLAFNIYHRTP